MSTAATRTTMPMMFARSIPRWQASPEHRPAVPSSLVVPAIAATAFAAVPVGRLAAQVAERLAVEPADAQTRPPGGIISARRLLGRRRGRRRRLQAFAAGYADAVAVLAAIGLAAALAAAHGRPFAQVAIHRDAPETPPRFLTPIATRNRSAPRSTRRRRWSRTARFGHAAETAVPANPRTFLSWLERLVGKRSTPRCSTQYQLPHLTQAPTAGSPQIEQTRPSGEGGADAWIAVPSPPTPLLSGERGWGRGGGRPARTPRPHVGQLTAP